MSLDIWGPAAPNPPKLGFLNENGPLCVWSWCQPCGPSASCLFNNSAASPVTPPLPWVQYGSKAKALMGSCSISKQVWLKLWGEGKCWDSLFDRLTSSTKAAHWLIDWFYFSSSLYQMFFWNFVYWLLKSMKGFKPQLFGFTDFVVGMKHQT